MDRESAFRDFVAARSGSLMRLALLLCGDHQLAEDLLQTTMTKVYFAWGRIRDPAAAHGYARRVMATTYTSWWRRRSFGERPMPAPERGADGLADLVADRDELRRLLSGLPKIQRAVLVLRFYEDLPVGETARILQLNEGTVKSHTSRALARLGVDLEDTTLPAKRSPG